MRPDFKATVLPDSADDSLVIAYRRWCDLVSSGRLPSLSDMLAHETLRDHPGLAIIEVEWRDVGKPRFRFGRTEVLAEAFDRDGEGYALDEMVTPDSYPGIERTYRIALDERRGHYWIRTIVTRQGDMRSFERLLLPLSEDGHTVERLLGLFVRLKEGDSDVAEAI